MILKKCQELKETRWFSTLKTAFTYSSAAAVILLIAINVWLWKGGNRFTIKQPFTEIYAPYGSRINFNLPDGSSGWLNSGSSLKFPLRFANNERKVILKGEGYFNVISNPKKSFVVSTKFYQVRALGTSFNVLAYSDLESFEEVTLENGIVQIEKLDHDGIARIQDIPPGSFKLIFPECGKVESVE